MFASYVQSALYSAAQNGINPHDYMSALLDHSDAVIEAPDRWLPWVYKEALEAEAGSLRQDGCNDTGDP